MADPAERDPSEGQIRLVVNVTRSTEQAIERASELTGETRTDVVNRAIILYEYLALGALQGQHLLLEKKDGEPMEVVYEPFARIHADAANKNGSPNL